MILKSELNTKNKMTAFGALAVPVLGFTFVIVNWRVEERHKSTAKLEILTMYEMHYPKADWLCVREKE